MGPEAWLKSTKHLWTHVLNTKDVDAVIAVSEGSGLQAVSENVAAVVGSSRLGGKLPENQRSLILARK
eukprot:2862724-Amphidinium_carterae.1